MTISREHHRFLLANYEQMIDLGILTENDRVELIHGEILEKEPIGPCHAACVRRLTRLLGTAYGTRVCVGVHDPIRLADSEPEPDISLLQPRDDNYASSHPEPREVILLVEVAEASLDFDRAVKGPLYAENGIAEYWILNLFDRTLEVHRQPEVTGKYTDVRVLGANDTVELTMLPGAILTVAELFPPGTEQ